MNLTHNSITLRPASDVWQGVANAVSSVDVDAGAYARYTALTGDTAPLLALFDLAHEDHKAAGKDRRPAVGDQWALLRKRLHFHARVVGFSLGFPDIRTAKGALSWVALELAKKDAAAAAAERRAESERAQREHESRVIERRADAMRALTLGDIYADAVAKCALSGARTADLAALLVAGLSDQERADFNALLTQMGPPKVRRTVKRVAPSKAPAVAAVA